MTYAPDSRAFYDADSHIMELPDFLKKYADPKIRDDLPEVSYSASLVTDEEVQIIMDQGGRHSDEHVENMISLGNDLIAKSKEIQALGAFNKDDRKVAMDMLGFKKQLVFATHSVAFPFHPSSKSPGTCATGQPEHTIDIWQTSVPTMIVSWGLASCLWITRRWPLRKLNGLLTLG